MGKNKGGGKKPNIFKVAGAKSLKAKLKAKPVTGNLKKINEIVRKNVDKINENLVHLQKDLREKKDKKFNSNSNLDTKVNEPKRSIDFEKDDQKTLKKLEEMQF